jgi:hypothetical protein
MINGEKNDPRILYIVLYVHMKNGKENYPKIFDIFLFSHIVRNCMSDNFRKLKIYDVYCILYNSIWIFRVARRN